MKVIDIYLSIGKQTTDHIDETGEYTDVVVSLDNGKKYIASFFSYESIEKLKLKHQKTGDYLSGKYFKVDNMVLIERCVEEEIEKVVMDLMDEGEFGRVFKLIS